MERRKIFRQYFFSVVVILCLSAFLCGSVTVKEKTDYNMRLTPYDVINAEKNQDGIEVSFAGETYFLKRALLKKLSKDAISGEIGGFFIDISKFFSKKY